MSVDLLKHLSSRYQEEMKNMSDDMCMGVAKDHGDYKYACGIYRGLLIANNIIMETAEKLQAGEDE